MEKNNGKYFHWKKDVLSFFLVIIFVQTWFLPLALAMPLSFELEDLSFPALMCMISSFLALQLLTLFGCVIFYEVLLEKRKQHGESWSSLRFSFRLLSLYNPITVLVYWFVWKGLKRLFSHIVNCVGAVCLMGIFVFERIRDGCSPPGLDDD